MESIITNTVNSPGYGWATLLFAILFGLLCIDIAERKGMDRFKALLAGGFFGIFAVIYYSLAEPSKQREANPTTLYALTALASAVIIGAAIILA